MRPKTPLVFVAAASVAAVASCTSTNSLTTDELVHQLRNSDITWGGSYGGFTPRTTGDTARAIRQRGISATPLLVEALDDPQRFAAAHVVLTEMHFWGRSFHSTPWNGLRVTLYGDGTVDLHSEQMPSIKEFWDRELGGT